MALILLFNCLIFIDFQTVAKKFFILVELNEPSGIRLKSKRKKDILFTVISDAISNSISARDR